jgi:hypothetical protein
MDSGMSIMTPSYQWTLWADMSGNGGPGPGPHILLEKEKPTYSNEIMGRLRLVYKRTVNKSGEKLAKRKNMEKRKYWHETDTGKRGKLDKIRKYRWYKRNVCRQE